MVAQAHGRFDAVQAALRQQVPDGLEEALGGVRIGRILDRQGAVPRNLRVFFQAGRLLEFQHGQEHQGDGFPVGQVVFCADAVGKGMDIPRQLGVDGVAAVHRRPTHAQPRFDVLRGVHHRGQVLKDQPDTVQGKLHVLLVHLRVADGPFDAMAEGVDAAGGRYLPGGVHGKFTVENDMGHFQADQYGGTLHAMIVQHHGAHGHFGAGAGRRGNHDHGQRAAPDGQELQEQGLDRQVGHFYPGSHHLAGVHHRAAAEGDDAVGAALQRQLPSRLDRGDGGFGMDIVKHGAAHAGRFQRSDDGLFETQRMERPVRDEQHLLVAVFTADSADLPARSVTFRHVRFRQGNRVYDLSGQLVYLFPEAIGIHSSRFLCTAVQRYDYFFFRRKPVSLFL